MLLETLKDDCGTWIASNEILFMNECEIQLRLSHYLMETKHYGKVYVEYAVPLENLKAVAENHVKAPIKFGKEEYPWTSQMYIDIVVEKKRQFAAVELKYATTFVDRELTVFEEKPQVNIIKYQGAQDIVMYGYWKDVRRIEALTRFENMVGGVALIVSNDNAYWTKPEGEPGYSLFSVHENAVVKGKLEWKGRSGDHTKETYPAFTLDGEYSCHWQDTRIPFRARKGNAPFRYMVSVISKQI